ncbi:MAG: hypothetical protein WAX66_01935 [Patescibacteria group bacterium]
MGGEDTKLTVLIHKKSVAVFLIWFPNVVVYKWPHTKKLNGCIKIAQVSFQATLRSKDKELDFQEIFNGVDYKSEKYINNLLSRVSKKIAPRAKVLLKKEGVGIRNGDKVIARTRRDTFMSNSECYVLRGVASVMRPMNN